MKQSYIHNDGESLISGTNLILFGLIIALVAFGLNILLASSSFMAREQFSDPYFFLKKQAFAAFLGFLGMLAATQVDPNRYRQWVWPLYALAIFLLVLVFVPGIGKRAGGANRWIVLGGLSLQPSDFAKVALILVLARIYSQAPVTTEREHGSIDWRLSFVTLFIIALPTFLIAIEQDLGTAIHLVLVASTLLFFTRYPLIMQIGAFLVSVTAAGYIILKTPFRLGRISAWLNPWDERYGAGFQLVASMKSFLAGGLTGKGLGEELVRHHLQERHTDFILAIVAEDLGALGVIALLAAYFLIAFYALILAARIRDDFMRLLATGCVLALILQVVINAGVTMGIFPTKGINLPLVSNGGTSLFVYMVMCGMMLSALRREQV
ncbi:MAG TPA: putative peptidoglycan glycosyltransferase FtsW [Turneriella sp.]|nr:putative peptidoglycan glycosyltransferase FtsW [Turneriella sp.]